MTSEQSRLLDLISDQRSLTERFQRSEPVKHLIIDDFLNSPWANQVLEDFPDLSTMPKSRDYVFSNKRELSTLDLGTPSCRALHQLFTGAHMAGFLSELVGNEITVDPEYLGGGFHAGAPGSYLDLHVDFNIHPLKPTWLRELNLLLYLNPGWQPSWGGHLKLSNSPTSAPVLVEPLFNRLVIMESTSSSFHGYDAITFPAGTARRSVAAYGYSICPSDTSPPKRRTTQWVPESAALPKRVLAANWNRLVLTKNRLLGSATAKNRRV